MNVGEGFLLDTKVGKVFGVVMNVTNTDVEYAEVSRICDMRTGITRKCYNDPGAKWATDRDNVRLKDCPPPFSILSVKGKDGTNVNNAYAYANMSSLSKCSVTDFQTNAKVLDDGELVSDKTMAELRNHPWPFQIEKEKVFTPTTEAPVERGSEFDYIITTEPGGPEY